MDCIAEQDANCSAAGYAPQGLVRSYDGEVENNGDPNDRSADFWRLLNALSHISLATWNTSNLVENNVAGFLYNETTVMTDGSHFGLEPSAEYPFNQTHLRFGERAVISVDGDCRMREWNQTGSAEDKRALDKNCADLIAVPVIFCAVYPDDASCTSSSDGGGNNATADAPTTGGSSSPPISRVLYCVWAAAAAVVLFLVV